MSWTAPGTWFPPRCQSPHVSAAQSHCERVSWDPPREDEGEGRLIRWTCGCSLVVYELVQMGGVQFIRRTQRRKGKPLVHETQRWIAKVAESNWNALLCGHLR